MLQPNCNKENVSRTYHNVPGYAPIFTWSSSPNIPSGLLSRFAERAGVHLYSSRGDQVFPSKNWIAVHCKWDDVLELRLPEPGTWRDAFTNETLIENSDLLRLKTHRGENVVLERTDPRPNQENGK